MNIVLTLALVFLFGILSTRISKWLKLPSVTGYLLVGLLLGPFGLKVLEGEILESVSVITTVALGFIAFTIGEELHFDSLRKIGKHVFVITIMQSVFAVLFVIIGLFGIQSFFPNQLSLPVILLLGAIATATAPAATLMVVRQYKAKGPVTENLLPVVALDDAVGLIVFSICFAFARSYAIGATTAYGVIVLQALAEIFASLLLGVAIGYLLVLAMKFIKDRSAQFVLALFAVMLGIGLCEIDIEFEISALLVCMMIGTIFVNNSKPNSHVFKEVDTWTIPLYMLFFIISGAELNLAVLPTVGVVGLVYIVLRAVGKYVGAYAGAAMVNSDKNVKKYLGLTLLPQAGVAIGMAQMVADIPDMAAYATTVVTVVLCATLVYELIGPLATKIALTKAGEIATKRKKQNKQTLPNEQHLALKSAEPHKSATRKTETE